MNNIQTKIVSICLSLLTSPLLAQDKTIVVSTLEWPPYTGSGLRHEGATTEVVRQAFAAAGYDIKVVFRP